MNELATTETKALTKINAVEAALIGGDLAKLTAEERLQLVDKICDSLGLNKLTKPFEYINLKGKLTLYAKKDATEQLRKINGVSIKLTRAENKGDLYIVYAAASDRFGRVDEATGAVSIANLKGDDLANAIMKAETKAKRRVTLSICGLGFLDESELGSVVTENQKASVQSQMAKIEALMPKTEVLNVVANPSDSNSVSGSVSTQQVVNNDGKQKVQPGNEKVPVSDKVPGEKTKMKILGEGSDW